MGENFYKKKLTEIKAFGPKIFEMRAAGIHKENEI